MSDADTPNSSYPAKPLPAYLIKRHHGWKATEFEENRSWYARLADEGQRPRAMVISCCDSRVRVTSLFGADSGDFFIHRNIAALVPPYAPDAGNHGTSSAIEYAVNHLKVSNIMIVGHSLCGGVQGCFDMCNGDAPELEEGTSFIGRWMDNLRPGFEKVKDMKADRRTCLEALEKEAVLLGVNNLMTFPFVAERVNAGDLHLHAVWNDIGTGGLEFFDAAENMFRPV